ncbi:MAG: hypothetical protein M3Q75_01800 [Gemmatimonadota bacterium]|nr:hypothetical protein [Gemmatimonadota bacterium]
MTAVVVAISLLGEAGAVTVVALLGSCAGLIGAAGTYALQRRDAKRNVHKDYVDANFAVQQGVIEMLRTEDTRLRALNEQRLDQIETLEDEIVELHGELTRCRKKCDDCLKRVTKLEREQSS